MGCGQKSFKLVWRCHQLLSDSYPKITSVTLVTNDKNDYEMIPGAAYRSSGICLTAEENTGKKPQLGDSLGYATSHRLKWGLFLPNEAVGLHSTSGREKKGKKERTGQTPHLVLNKCNLNFNRQETLTRGL